jgi:MFS family permease
LGFFRFLGGVADAAALGAVLSILMKLFPKYVTSIVSWTEMLFGLGYMLGNMIKQRTFKGTKQHISLA